MKTTPAVAAGDGCWVRNNWLAVAALTVTAGLVPVIVSLAESVAVIVWLPAVSRITPAEFMRSGVGGGERVGGGQARHLAIGAAQVHRALVLVRTAADGIVVRVVRRDGHHGGGTGHVWVREAGGHHEVGGFRRVDLNITGDDPHEIAAGDLNLVTGPGGVQGQAGERGHALIRGDGDGASQARSAGTARQCNCHHAVVVRVDLTLIIFGVDDQAESGAGGQLARRRSRQYQMSGRRQGDVKAGGRDRGEAGRCGEDRVFVAKFIQRQVGKAGDSVRRPDLECATQGRIARIGRQRQRDGAFVGGVDVTLAILSRDDDRERRPYGDTAGRLGRHDQLRRAQGHVEGLGCDGSQAVRSRGDRDPLRGLFEGESRKDRDSIVHGGRQCSLERIAARVVLQGDRHRTVVVNIRVSQAILNRDREAESLTGGNGAGRLRRHTELGGNRG